MSVRRRLDRLEKVMAAKQRHLKDETETGQLLNDFRALCQKHDIHFQVRDRTKNIITDDYKFDPDPPSDMRCILTIHHDATKRISS